MWTSNASESSLVLCRLRFLFRGRDACVGSLNGKPAVRSPYGEIGEIGERHGDIGVDTGSHATIDRSRIALSPFKYTPSVDWSVCCPMATMESTSILAVM